MSRDFILPRPDEVGSFYDQINEILAATQGGSMHYGYWTGPDDESSFQEASERFTRLLMEKLDADASHRVLDAGCGPGKPAVELATATGASVLGISVSAHDVELATARAAAAGVADRVTFQRANALELPFPDASFDRVLALESIVHIPDRTAVLREFARVLRPGGRLALTDFVVRQPAERGTAADHAALVDVLASWWTAPLIGIDDYRSFTRDAGLELEEVLDVTQHTKYSNLKTYAALYERARYERDLPPELTRILDAGPGRDGLHLLVDDDPSEGVIVVSARRPLLAG